MKTAVIFSGFIRDFKNTFTCLNNNLLSINDHIDIYMHLYEDEPIRTGPKYGGTLIQGGNSQEVIDLYQPKKYIIEPIEKSEEPPCEISDKCRNSANPVANNFFNMHNNIKKAFGLIPKDTYDCVVRSRYDIELKAPICLEQFNMNHIHIPAGGDFNGGIFDMFAFSNFDNMRHYCSLVDHINDYVEQGILFDPERLLKHHLLPKFTISRFNCPVFLRGKLVRYP